jgi:hypothetical protein
MRRILYFVPTILGALALVACKDEEIVKAAEEGGSFLSLIGGATGLLSASAAGNGILALAAWYRGKKGLEASKWVNAPKDANDIAEDIVALKAQPEMRLGFANALYPDIVTRLANEGLVHPVKVPFTPDEIAEIHGKMVLQGLIPAKA